MSEKDIIEHNEELLNHDIQYHTHHNDRYYAPWYDDSADYNTNAKSYYDYLARFKNTINWIINAINKLFKRTVEVQDTSTIDLTKLQDWNEILEGQCEKLDNLKDITLLKADVIFSKLSETLEIAVVGIKNVPNGSKDKQGVWSPDYRDTLVGIGEELVKILNEINNIKNEIANIKNDIVNIKNDIANIKNDLQNLTNNFNNFAENQEKYNNFIEQIYNNLVTDGGYTGEMGDGNLTANLAYGNINFFGGTVDGGSYIRTNKGTTENDVTAGIT